MFWKLSLFAMILMASFATAVIAHPLGNFSVNQYSKLETGKSEIHIRQVMDMAEIPTFQESSRIDTDKNGTFSDKELSDYLTGITPDYLKNLVLTINGDIIPIRSETQNIHLVLGAGNLQTLRMEWDLVANITAKEGVNKVVFQNDNFSERIGWREIIINRTVGTEIFDSTAFGSGITDELKAYPVETLSSPLGERTAEFSFTSGSLPQNAKPLQNRDGHITVAVQKDRLAELISVKEITPSIALLGLLIAMGFGAFHAMSPGHGKAVVGAYLVGSKGTAKHAVFLGLIVTVTHTLGVFALGLLTLFASNYILPETLMPFLSFFSGLIVLYIGLTMFKTRLFSALGYRGGQHHDHGGHSHSNLEAAHTHSHDDQEHTHDGHTHTHAIPDEITWKSLLALGVSGGLLPCPSALVLMLSAISGNRIGYGIILTIAFSFGLAATLTLVGLLFLYGGRLFDGGKLSQSRIMKALPVVSAFVIACLGAVICYTSLP